MGKARSGIPAPFARSARPWEGHGFIRADKAEAGPSADLYKTCGTQKCPPFHHNQNFGYVASSRVANYVVSIMLRCFLFRAESCCCAFAIVVALCGASSAQNNAPPPQSSSDSGTSLANVVRNSKAHKASHAKKVIGDDDLESSAGPLPKLTMDGAENADDVVAAIKAYKEIHTLRRPRTQFGVGTKSTTRNWPLPFKRTLTSKHCVTPM